ncbi:MAG: AAC(3) family N-acetyltransferase [Oligoflexia bacterium]|nr:AAC(3) family N-acetyltransferase [Oligoflexia bacterium]
MKTYTVEEIKKSLSECGIKQGDTILMHSSLYQLGLLDSCSTKDLCENIFQIITKYLGAEGTLLVPAFFYEYARCKLAFDVKLSPVSKSLGVFPQYIVTRSDCVRSLNPTTCLAGIGKNANYICNGKSAKAFGINSPWHKLHTCGGKIISFGGKETDMLTFLHHVEHMFGVPHMYHKYYTVPIFNNGEKINLPVSSFVRYLDYNIEHDHNKFVSQAHQEGIIKHCSLGMSNVFCCLCEDLFDLGIKCLEEDTFYFLAQRPSFLQSEYPLI